MSDRIGGLKRRKGGDVDDVPPKCRVVALLFRPTVGMFGMSTEGSISVPGKV